MSKKFKHTDLKRNFTKVSNNLILTDELDMREKMVYIYISSQKDDWKFANDRMARAMKISKDTMRKILQSLENKGVLERKLISGTRTYEYNLIKNFDQTEED